MRHYDYVGVDASGKTLKSALEAETEGDFKEALKRKGLFLVSWEVRGESAPAGQAAPLGYALITDDMKLSSIDIMTQGVRRFLKTPKGLALLGGVLLAGLLKDYVYLAYFSPVNPFFVRSTELESKFAKIHPGATRLEVESILPARAPGPAPAGETRYKINPTLMVRVPYDNTGGIGSASNKVTGLFALEFSAAPPPPPPPAVNP